MTVTPKDHPLRPSFLRALPSSVVLLAAAFLLPFSLGAQQAPEPTRKEDVRHLLDTELQSWMDALPDRRPRLFLSAEQYDALPQRYQNATGQERKLFDALLARAEQIIETPLPTYRTPEEMVTERVSLFAAQEELWMRDVGDDMVALAIAAQISGDERFKDYLRELVLSACEYPQWGVRPKNAALAAGHVSRGIALAYDWHHDIFDEAQRQKIRDAIAERMNDMHKAFYNPGTWSIHYHANHNHVAAGGAGVAGLAFLGEIPEAAQWSAAALLNFQKVAELNNADGSTTEGVGYWSYALSYILQYMEAVRPVLPTEELYQAPFFRNAAAFRLHSSTSGFSGTLAYGASGARDFRGPHQQLYRLASQYQDGGAQYIADNLPYAPTGGADGIALSALWYDPSIPSVAPAQLDNHIPVADIVTMRSGWDKTDYLLAIKSGFTNRNHSHLDAGTLTFAFSSQWLIDTPGYGYGGGNPNFWKRATGERWTFFTNATESHSTLLVNGKNQRYDPQARSTVTEFLSFSDQSWTRIDMQRAYHDTESIERTVLHRRGDYALVWDAVKTTQPATLEWLLKVPDIAHLADGSTLINGNRGSLEVRPLFPPKGAFDFRTHTSEHINLPPERLKVTTLSQEGSNMNYLVALLPTFAGQESNVQSIQTEEIEGGLFVFIEGQGWKDRLYFATAASTTPLRGTLAANDATTGANDATTGANNSTTGANDATASALAASLHFNAEVASGRFIKDTLHSALLSGATEVAGADWHIHFASPATIALERTAPNDWVIAVAEPGTTISELGGSYVITPIAEENTAPNAGQKRFTLGDIPAGEYLLTPLPASTAPAQLMPR